MVAQYLIPTGFYNDSNLHALTFTQQSPLTNTAIYQLFSGNTAVRILSSGNYQVSYGMPVQVTNTGAFSPNITASVFLSQNGVPTTLGASAQSVFVSPVATEVNEGWATPSQIVILNMSSGDYISLTSMMSNNSITLPSAGINIIPSAGCHLSIHKIN